MSIRHVPLIVIGSATSALADSVAARLRRDGSVVYVTHSPEGCLRVATSVAPDVVLLDQRFPGRIVKLLKAPDVRLLRWPLRAFCLWRTRRVFARECV